MDNTATQREELAAGLWERLQDPDVSARDYASLANALARLLKEIEEHRRQTGEDDGTDDQFLHHLESLANGRRYHR